MKHILLLTFAAVSLIAADATGRWAGTLTVPTSDGSDKPGPALLVLKQEGAQLTGTAGPDANEQHPIEKGKVENGNLTFEVPTEDTIMKFALKHEGDEIKGDITREREGQTQRAKLAVKRDK
ncbi:MAG: hypothetical protein WD696_16860 [Bryobacteraceae bacterium]